VLVAGYYGAGNTGDEAILTVVLRDLRALRPDLEFTVVSADAEATAARYGVRSLAGSDIPAILDAAQESALVVLGGGGVFHDHWGCPPDSLLTRGHAGIPFYAGFPLLAVLTGRPSMIYAAGVGPLTSDEGRRLTRAAFEAASIATVRDSMSRDLLADIGVAGVDVTADPAFAVQPDLDGADAILSRLRPERRTPLIAVCMRTWMPGGPAPWEDHVARALDDFIDRTGAVVVFVPFQALPDDALTDDVAAAARVMARMRRPARAVSVAAGRGPETIAGLLARCDLVVGMRLHALVLAASAGVPAVGLAYDPKVTSLMRELALPDYVLPLGAASALGERMAAAWAGRDLIVPALAATSAHLRKLATANASLALGLLDVRPLPRSGPTSMDWVRAFALQQTRRLAEQEAPGDTRSARALADAEEIAALSARAQALADQVTALRQSAAFRGMERLRRARRRLAPAGTRRARAVDLTAWAVEKIARKGLAASLARAPRFVARAASAWFFRPRGVWALDSRQPGDPVVTLYTDRDELFPDHRPRRPLAPAAGRHTVVSLIATTRNEAPSVPGWLESVADQTRLPDEIVVVDAGSTDGTVAALHTGAARLGLAVTVLVEPHANIARGRNVAIARARGTVLACTDLGCRLTATWLERIVAPFEDDQAMQVVAGWYVALERGRPARRRWLTLDHVDPGNFVPSSRSIAFTRRAWQTAGGYPEWLTLTGEDTWFALELRRLCEHWAFVPDAVVAWDAPRTMMAYWRKIHAWACGDGESGVGAPLYWQSFERVAGVVVAAAVGLAAVAITWATVGFGPALIVLAGGGLLGAVAARWRAAIGPRALAWEVGGEAARALGFLRGAARRQHVFARRHRAAQGIVFIMSGVPIDDTGGGARCTQLALEFLRQGWFVVFVSRFPRQETIDLRLRIRHPRLLTVAFEGFVWRRFLRDHSVVFREYPALAIVEFPLAEFVPLASTISRAGGTIVYDLLDDWDSALGGTWYSPAIEREVIALSDVLTATAPPLAARLKAISGREVVLLPNAVDSDLFDPDRSWARPADFPSAAWSMIYVGALWGDWFDWDLLRRLALVYPEASVVMIGDYRNQMSRPPTNVRFLGLKAQRELPAYLAHADVAIVPWKVNSITRATSPLKVYEYLAMRRPVVAPDLETLAGIPGVLRSRDGQAFVADAGRAREARVDHATVSAFVRDNCWPARLRTLLEASARAAQRPRSPRRDHADASPIDA
jgi:polysaccharide pyruvyl transferase CsaB